MRTPPKIPEIDAYPLKKAQLPPKRVYGTFPKCLKMYFHNNEAFTDI